MTDNNISQADAAAQARGADPMLSEATGAEAGDRPVFDFDNQNEGGVDAARTTQGSLKDKAVGRLRTEADNHKSIVSDHLKQVSGALGAVGGQGPNGQNGGGEAPAWLTSSVGQATQFIDRVADRVENADSAELLEDIRGMARANPALFLGACALAGFVAVRILSAGDGR